MADFHSVTRLNPTDGFRFASSVVSIEAASQAKRFVLRATDEGAQEVGKEIGLPVPTSPGESSTRAGLTILWIGPDEWLILDESGSLSPSLPDRESSNYCLVDVSHRNSAFLVSGDGAVNTLNASCPRDLSLSAFPVGSGSRTVFGKVEIVLLRTATISFRIECWRSYVPYVQDLLLTAAKDALSE